MSNELNKLNKQILGLPMPQSEMIHVIEALAKDQKTSLLAVMDHPVFWGIYLAMVARAIAHERFHDNPEALAYIRNGFNRYRREIMGQWSQMTALLSFEWSCFD